MRRCIFKIYKTEFVNPKFSYVEWSENNKFYEFEDVESKTEERDEYIFKLKNLREGYRQMKNHFISVDNKFDAMVFQSNELRTQYRIKEIETWSIGLRSWKNNFGDWFILATNNWFSNFGLSWTRPLLWWLCWFHAILFYCMLISFPKLEIRPSLDIWNWEYTGFDWDATWEGLDLYLKLLFPVHDTDVIKPFTDTVPPTTVDVWGKLDFAMRIVSSYFLFLIIRGTRKFNFKIGT